MIGGIHADCQLPSRRNRGRCFVSLRSLLDRRMPALHCGALKRLLFEPSNLAHHIRAMGQLLEFCRSEPVHSLSRGKFENAKSAGGAQVVRVVWGCRCHRLLPVQTWPSRASRMARLVIQISGKQMKDSEGQS